MSGNGHTWGCLILCRSPFETSSLQGGRWRREGPGGIRWAILTSSCTELPWATELYVTSLSMFPPGCNSTRDPQEGSQSGLVFSSATQAYLGSRNGRCQAQQVVGGSGTSGPLGGWGCG